MTWHPLRKNHPFNTAQEGFGDPGSKLEGVK
uniref:Uncharacterized protein n=1 Tax=Arundo donax TaxID=35708 RepID=A0A0A9AWU0_ARUDO